MTVVRTIIFAAALAALFAGCSWTPPGGGSCGVEVVGVQYAASYGSLNILDTLDGWTVTPELQLDPVTTANGTTFTNQRGVQREPNKKSYLEFECYFIATEPMWVHLTTESSQTIEGDNGTRVTSTSPAPQNEVVQCTRVGFTTDADGTAVYEPNKGTQINGLNTFDISTPMTYSDSSRLFHLDELTPKKATLRIWVDGEDPQCDDDVQLS